MFARHGIVYHGHIQQVLIERLVSSRHCAGDPAGGETGLLPVLTEFKVWEKNYPRNVMFLATLLASENFRRILPRLAAGQMNSYKMEKKISPTGKIEGGT